MSMSIPVLPCPFCRGGRLGILQVGPVPAFALTCGSCGAAGPMAGGPETAIELWNRADRVTGHGVCGSCGAMVCIRYGGERQRVPVVRVPICSECEKSPPPAAGATPPAAVGAKKKAGAPLRFCEADTLISEQDGSVSVRRGPGCSCPKEGA